MGSVKRLGYWLNERKAKKLSWNDVLEEFRHLNIEPIKVDFDQPLEQQGPFHGILHKLTDFIALGDLGEAESRRMVLNLESYTAAHPDVTIIDPVDCVRTVVDRFKTYSLISAYASDEKIFVPSFVVLNSNNLEDIHRCLTRASTTFPMVCKPIVAHGSSAAHEMTLVFNLEGLRECSFPCVVQSFVNHGAVLYKLFALGDNFFMVERPSIKNLEASDDAAPIHFHSGDISKPTSCSQLTVQENAYSIIRPPSDQMLQRIVTKIRQVLRLGLFGVDVVVEESTGRLAIIDVNCFPGYDGVENFPEHIAAFVRTELDKNDVQIDATSNGPNSSDDALDTTRSRAFP